MIYYLFTNVANMNNIIIMPYRVVIIITNSIINKDCSPVVKYKNSYTNKSTGYQSINQFDILLTAVADVRKDKHTYEGNHQTLIIKV